MQMVRMAILLVDDLASAEDVVQEAFAGPVPQLGRAAGSQRSNRVPADGRGQRIAINVAP